MPLRSVCFVYGMFILLPVNNATTSGVPVSQRATREHGITRPLPADCAGEARDSRRSCRLPPESWNPIGPRTDACRRPPRLSVADARPPGHGRVPRHDAVVLGDGRHPRARRRVPPVPRPGGVLSLIHISEPTRLGM